MKNYHAYDVAPFLVTYDEIEKLECDILTPNRIPENLKYLRNKYGEGVERFETRRLPKTLRRNRSDSACLLILYTTSGRILAKRHNNSQWLTL